MKVIIVDDEQLARDELTFLLKPYTDIEVIAGAENISKAQQLIEDLLPDIVFLDINMPEGDGFELLERLTYTPTVIFTTAYDQYAIKAFEVNAFDYLLKPIDEKRLQKAIEQLPRTDNKNTNIGTAGTSDKLNKDSKIFIKDREKSWFVRVGDIVMFESVGNYCKVYFAANTPMVKRSLAVLDERLPDDTFIRANRQSIINMEFITEIETIEGGLILLSMANGKQVEMSRRQSQEFRVLNSL